MASDALLKKADAKNVTFYVLQIIRDQTFASLWH